MAPEVLDLNTLDDETKGKVLKTGALFHTLAADPKYRREVLKLIKAAAPDTVIPELEVEDTATRMADERVKPLADRLEAGLKRVGEMEGRLSRQQWRDTMGLSEDELIEVEELAKTAGITKGETAVKHWRNEQVLGTPRGSRREKGADEYLGKLAKISPRNQPALKRAAIEQGERIIREMRGGRLAG